MIRKNVGDLLGAWFDQCLNALALVGAVIVVFVTFAMSCDALSRYLLGSSMAWVFNVSQHLLAYLVFLAAAWVLRDGGHVKIDLVEERLSTRHANMLRLATSFLSMIACGVLVYSGMSSTLQSLQWNTVLPGPPPVHEFILVGVIPLGSFLLIIQFGRECRKYLSKIRQGR